LLHLLLDKMEYFKNLLNPQKGIKSPNSHLKWDTS
jgi:hypothetical protein